jgi:hypothetical protein
MLRLKPGQRAVIVDKAPDLANLAAGVLVLGQFVGGDPPSVGLMILGAALWIAIAGITFVMQEANHDSD